jgi:hypothetical protein
MANGLYAVGRAGLLSDIDLAADDIKACLAATATYTVDLAADAFLDDVTGIPSGGTSGNLASKTVTAGAFDAANFSFAAVDATTECALIIYKDTGDPATSTLIAYIDSVTVTPNGGQIDVAVHASGLFSIPVGS